jgi:molybdopterin converting factor subunit 1
MAANQVIFSMNNIKLVFFATLRDKAGTRTAEITVADTTTVRQLKERVLQAYPLLKPVLASALVAVNREYSSDETPIPENAEVAFFPPVSGG